MATLSYPMTYDRYTDGQTDRRKDEWQCLTSICYERMHNIKKRVSLGVPWSLVISSMRLVMDVSSCFAYAADKNTTNLKTCIVM